MIMRALSAPSDSCKDASLIDKDDSSVSRLSAKKMVRFRSLVAAGAMGEHRGPAVCHKLVPINRAHRRSQKTLQKLQELVSRAPRQRRREVLERIPLQVRILLLRFMEEAAGRCKAKGACSSRRRICIHSCSLRCDSPMEACRSMGDDRMKGCGSSTAKCHRKENAAFKADAPGGMPVKKARLGVSHKAGGYLARARIVPYLDAVTCCQSSWASAAGLHEVLQRVKALATFDSSHTDEGEHLRTCIDAACAEAHISTAQLGLSFCARVDAHAVVGRTVAGSYSTDLNQVLAQRRRLLAARAKGWQSLRSEWIGIMQAAVPTRMRAWGFGRSRPKAAEQAIKIADTAERAYAVKLLKAQEHVWKRFLHRLARAAHEVADAAAAEAQEIRLMRTRAAQRHAAEAMRERCRVTQQQRWERWHWLNDPARTMEEILEG